MKGVAITVLVLIISSFSGCTEEEKNNANSWTNIREISYANRVIDGDTFESSDGNIVRILGINTPERGEKYYMEAGKKLRTLIEGRVVELEIDGENRDKFARKLRHVFVDNTNVGEQILRNGFALTYLQNIKKYSKDFSGAEEYAKENKLGLWEKNSQNICNFCIVIEELVSDPQGDDCKNPNGEFVIFKNTCDFSCGLNNWVVRDESSSHRFTFEDFNLSSEDRVVLHSGCGQSSGSDVYWCASKSCSTVWNNDLDRLIMTNQFGEIVVEHSYVE